VQQHDRQRFAAAFSGMAEYYEKTPSKTIIQMYWQGLESYEIESVEQAISAHIRLADNGQFMPRINDLVKLIEGSSSDKAAIAWSKVLHAVRSIGPYQTIVFDDPIVHVVLSDMGGFGGLCDVKTDDMPFRANEFQKIYRGYAARGSIPPYVSKLVGIAEQDNKARGYLQHIPPPVFVGDRARAENVLANGQTSVAIGTSRGIAELVDLTARRLEDGSKKSA
jgi:hypothetical protein